MLDCPLLDEPLPELLPFVPLNHITPPVWLPPDEPRTRSCPLAPDWPLPDWLLPGALVQLILSASLSPRLEDELPLLDCPLLEVLREASSRSAQLVEFCPEAEPPLLPERVPFWLNTHVPLLS